MRHRKAQYGGAYISGDTLSVAVVDGSSIVSSVSYVAPSDIERVAGGIAVVLPTHVLSLLSFELPEVEGEQDDVRDSRIRATCARRAAIVESEYAISYHLTDAPTGFIGVVAVYAPIDVLAYWRGVFRAAGMRVSAFYPESVALYAAHHVESFSDPELVVLCRAHQTTFTLFVEGRMVHAHTLFHYDDVASAIIDKAHECLEYYAGDMGYDVSNIVVAGDHDVVSPVYGMLKQTTSCEVVHARVSPALVAKDIARRVAHYRNKATYLPAIGAAYLQEYTGDFLGIDAASLRESRLVSPLSHLPSVRTVVESFILLSLIISGVIGLPHFNAYQYAKSVERAQDARVYVQETLEGYARAHGTTLEELAQRARAPRIDLVVIGETPTGWLRVRSGPDTGYAEIARVLTGEQYPLKGERYGWYNIDISPEVDGWVYGGYAARTEGVWYESEQL